MIYYITGNPNKVKSARSHLKKYDIQFESLDLKLIEIQSESIKEIALDKVKQAYDSLKKPIFVNDVGWSIPILNGFPGAYAKYVCSCFTPQDWLNLMKGKDDRRIFLEEYVVYKDNNQIMSFTHTIERTFAENIYAPHDNEYRFPSLDYVMKSQFGMTIAEHKEKNIKSLPENNLWDELGEFLRHLDLDKVTMRSKF